MKVDFLKFIHFIDIKCYIKIFKFITFMSSCTVRPTIVVKQSINYRENKAIMEDR